MLRAIATEACLDRLLGSLFENDEKLTEKIT